MAPHGGLTITLQWHVLRDDRGPVVRYVHDVRDGTPIADLAALVPGRSAAEAADVVLASRELAGWLLSTEDASLAARLVRMGARPQRHRMVMQCDLRVARPTPPLPAGLKLEALPALADAEQWRAMLPSWRAAFPPDHPDHFAGDDPAALAFLGRLVDGSELGPLHPCSALVRNDHGLPVAGLLVNVRPQEPPWGGPWIADIWRDPSLRALGIGPSLIGHAQHDLAAAGFTSLSLAVTHGNPARRTYERCGFRLVAESQTVLLPS